MPDFGNLKTVQLRNVWPHEAADFTPWLANNIAALGEALGVELEITQSEASVGDFSLDLLAKDLGTGRNVIIENQLTGTDHDHLGKLLTYASGFDAGTIIWIAEAIRDEHRRALDWLNHHMGDEVAFFGVVVEVLQIDDSKPAFHFKVVVTPSEWSRSGITPKPTSTKGEAYRQFFQSLIDELREKYHFTSAKAGQPQNWYSFSSGMRGVVYSASFPQGGRVRVEIYIDFGELSANKALFDRLFSERQSIEAAFGDTLEWERLDDRRASRIASYFPGSISDPIETLSSIREQIVNRLLRFKRSVAPFVEKHFDDVVLPGGMTGAPELVEALLDADSTP
jgi:hypothetical protein